MKNLELYIHIPFCIKKCDYCDFLSGEASAFEKKEYIRALLNEIKYQAYDCEDYEVSTIYFGGGTPSTLKAQVIDSILQEIYKYFHVKKDAEITIECNPGTLTEEKLQIYQKAGINRLSLGLQSADQEELKLLGRIHTYNQFKENFYLARRIGFANINVDLMSALPGQSVESYRCTLKKVCELGPEHISAYSLIIEEGTPFAECELDLPDEDTEYNMYEATAQILREYGFEQYEISNYAKKGRECRHNVGYWIRQDYLGFGLGASSLYGKERFANTQDMKKYLENSRTPEKIREKEPPLTREDEMAEFMFLGLRMTRGISKAEFERQFGSEIDAIYGDVLRKYKSMGLLLEENGRIFLSREGIHVSNSVMADFLP